MEMMKQRLRILLVCGSLSSFVRNDLRALLRHFDVKLASFDTTRLLLYPFVLLKFVFSLFVGIFSVDVVFSWFGYWQAFLAVIFAKMFGRDIRTITVAGGHDAACIPEVHYGAFASWWKGRIAKYVFENSDIVLAVSKYTKKHVLMHSTPRHIEVVYNGVDTAKFKPVGKKEKLVLTVAIGDRWRNVLLKGINTVIESAKNLPDTKFMIIGLNHEIIKMLKAISPENLELMGFVVQDDLIEYYQKAKVYLQLSLHESFNVSLAEAMLCECIPVVTKGTAMPEVVGDTGFLVYYGNSDMTVEAIKEALKAKGSSGAKARERIERYYSLERREKELVKEIEGLFF